MEQGASVGTAAAIVLLALAGCQPAATPPRNSAIDGLPVAGSVAFARQSGFTRCLDFNNYLRCRREGIRVFGEGPYSGAVDSLRADGSGGFRGLTLWSDREQHDVQAVGRTLLARGWQLCRTGQADRGDQDIYRRPGAKVRVSIDASYWGKRRLRIMPETGAPTGRCW